MNLLHVPIDIEWAVLGWALLLLPLWRTLRATATAAVLRGAQQHLWLAGVVLLACLWSLQVHTADGTSVGLLGAALYALVFGRHWARLGLLAAVALHTFLAAGNWANFGLNGLMFAVVPTLLAGALQYQLELRLPKNVFVFIIGNGMFVALAVTAATSLMLLALGWLTTSATVANEPIAYALLLAWGEALASGMLFAALVIFGPHLVLTYRQDLYLPPRRGL